MYPKYIFYIRFIIGLYYMDNQALLYSLDQKITLWDLKNQTDFDDYDFADIQSWTQNHNVHAIIDWQDNFHYKFNLIKSPPYIIYYIWNLDILNWDILGIVWPRKKTFYSDKVLDQLLSLARDYHLVTISGMAPWVDQLAHKLSIKHHIPTIAVLGGGIRWFMEHSDRNIIAQIVQNGWLVISEFKLDFKPTYYSFPQRNRIIAGLSNLLFLPQAGANSGSLITVDFALDMHKSVYGVPDSIFSLESMGINQYISDQKISLVSDFAKFLSSNFVPKSSPLVSRSKDIQLSPSQKTILSLISDQSSIWLDQLSLLSQMPYTELFAIMTILEMHSLVCQSSPGIYKIL